MVATYQELMDMIRYRAWECEIPFYGMFELTERCNLKCRFCYVCNRGLSNEKSSERTTGEWLGLIKEAADVGMLGCAFTGGDPFMRDDFEEIYCKSYDMGLRISIFTNGILIGNKQTAYLAKRVPDIVSISVYGASEDSYEQICGNGSNYFQMRLSLDRLHEAGIPFEIKVLAINPLLGEFEAIGHMAQTYQCPSSFSEYLGPGRDDPERMLEEWRIPNGLLKSSVQAFHKGSCDLLEASWRGPIPLAKERRNLSAIPCNAGKCFFCITHDGRMLGCNLLTCFSTYPFQNGFQNAWMELKQQVKAARACDECSTCPEYDFCTRCAANRFQETGSIEHCSAYLKEMVHALI